VNREAPLKYCYHGQHSRPLATFKRLPGMKTGRMVCADCYRRIMAARGKRPRVGSK